MQQFSQGRWRRRTIGLMLIPMTAMALAGIAAAPALARGGGTMTVAKTERSASLGKTVLATNKGRTLYSLSVETGGKFICTRTCLSVWHPLTVAAGVTPKGPVALGTIKRPEGSTQVTFHGHPLYSFDGDSSAGQANGQGIKDVGTWHAAVVPK
jgi:predicted lipoprotein with Yx(FWY)xxD motif